MNPEPIKEPSRPETQHSSPGAAIREARQRAGISIDELGSRTRLTRATLEAMEADAFDQLLEPVYVRGYYRKCARILEIAEEPLIKAYESVYTPPPRVVPARLRLAPSGDLNSTPRLSGRFAVIAPIIAILACAVIWLMRQAPSTSSLQDSVTLIDPENPSAIVSDAMPPLESPESSVDSVLSTSPQPEVAAAPAEEAPAAPAAPVGTALELEFTALSWARIEDATGKSLLSGVISEGERKQLDGTPPYSVFLGNAPGVKLRFGGLDVDMTPFTKPNATARFTVPVAGN